MSPTDAPPRRIPPAVLAALALAAVLAAAAGAPIAATRGAQTTGDEPQYLLSALSIARGATLDISDELAEERWRDFHAAQLPPQTRPLPRSGGPDRHISPHDPLLPLLLALPMALAGWIGAKLALSLVAGALAATLAWTATARFGVPPGVAVPVVAVFALSAPLAPYGNQVYPELPGALAVTVAVAAVTGPYRRAGRVALAAAVVALPWLAVKYAPVAAALAALALRRLWRQGERGAALGLALTGLAAAGVFAAVHVAVWGGVTPYAAGDHFVDGELGVVGFAPDYLGRSRRLIGLLVDRHFGLAAWQPAWLAMVPAVAWLARRRPPGWEVLVLPLAVGWLPASFVALTMHGYWFPGRQVVVVLPCAVLVVAMACERWAALRRATLVTGALGVWTYGWIVADGLRGRINWVVDLWRVGDPWYALWSELLPAYLALDAWQWLRHGSWLALAVAASVIGWGRAGVPAHPATLARDDRRPLPGSRGQPPGRPARGARRLSAPDARQPPRPPPR